MKMGFVGSILGTLPVFKGKGRFWRGFGIHSRIRVGSSRKADFIPKLGIGRVAK